ncbi:MAG: aldehyde dehydrogenase family protein [Saprospiraceae bacterium]|nr:aldehyde dehydrogenase family protein [Saprospiraceae bacterium]
MQTKITTISPIDGSVYVERELASGPMIEQALDKAEQARKIWRSTSLSERIELLNKALGYLVDQADEIGQELTYQMGRPIRYTPFEIKGGFQERAKYMTKIAPEVLADIELENSGEFQRFIRKEPIGTVLVLAPWNYPYLTSVNVIWPALLTGNTVLLKHAEQTPLCAERYAEAFAAAGLPEGVFQFLHLSHEQVAHVIADRRISYVAFTGSVNGGKAIQQAVGNRFITAGLELGGKDPAYVREDANLEQAIENLVDGAFFNSGQSCCGVERIYVHESHFKRFVEGAVELTKTYVLDNPLLPETTLGPMVRQSAAAFAQQQIERAVKKGAKPLVDPRFFVHHQPDTPYMAPQILIDVDHKMDVMRTESFAPVVGIMPVKGDAEAIQLMNDSPYGLTASVWTQDVEQAIQIGDQLETGTCFMNRCDYLDPALAWTGVKHSGKGYTLSSLGFGALTQSKSFHLRLPKS